MFEHVEPIVLASGFQSPEGPSFDRHGVLHCVDWDAQIIYRVTLDGQVSPLVNTAGMPTGSKFHRNGHLFVADGDRGILDVSPEGIIRVAASEWQGQRFRGPNDLVFASNGDLYFTDPKGSDPEHPIGNVFILRLRNLTQHPLDFLFIFFVNLFEFHNQIFLEHNRRPSWSKTHNLSVWITVAYQQICNNVKPGANWRIRPHHKTKIDKSD